MNKNTIGRTSSKQIGHLWSLSEVAQSLYWPVSSSERIEAGVDFGLTSPSAALRDKRPS